MSYKILNNILKTTESNAHLLKFFDDGVINLFSKCIDEQDSDWTHYGIARNRKGKFSFCYSDGKNGGGLRKDDVTYLSVSKFAKCIEGCEIDEIKSFFLGEMEELIRNYEIEKAKIDEKVEKKLKSLTEKLSN